jgi:hypothetical protein
MVGFSPRVITANAGIDVLLVPVCVKTLVPVFAGMTFSIGRYVIPTGVDVDP